jgi:hypothetical protein
MPIIPADYSEAHRLFVQAFISEGLLSETDADEKWKKVWSLANEDDEGSNHLKRGLLVGER